MQTKHCDIPANSLANANDEGSDPVAPPSPFHPDYLTRRDAVAAKAAGPGATPRPIAYTELENQTWKTVRAALKPRWRRHAIPEILDAEERLALPEERLPQLTEVTDRLKPRTGFNIEAVPGLVPASDFFGSLAESTFLSTQYVRYHGAPLHTPEPDVLHEVLGHATMLVDPHLAMLHREAGGAMKRMTTSEGQRFIGDVFWYAAEFGVIRKRDKIQVFGASLLSSVGELDWFLRNAEVRDIDVVEMGTVPYDIAVYQPILFAARSLNEVIDVVGEFFATVEEEDVARIRHNAGTAQDGAYS